MATSVSQRTGLIPFLKATAVEALDTHNYSTFLVPQYCIGSVPNGGYVASCILRAALLHLAPRGQSDTIAAHFEYINRSEVGAALMVVEDVKIGRAISVIQVTLYQSDLQPAAPWMTPHSRREVVAFITNTRISLERGLTLETGWSMIPPPPAVNFTKLVRGDDANWAARPKSTSGRANNYARVHENLEFYAPRQGQVRRGVEDSWIRLTSGERFSNVALGFVADAFPYVVEAWRPGADEKQVPFGHNEMFWYPTLALNMDVKKALPAEGAEWLFIRCSTKVIHQGRLDLEILILDEATELVAISSHVALILPAERNLGARSHTKKL
ncbi:Thioesterase family protein [Pleurostoma richardsiae]|uniref:Thioesterase family protein n=1 Tax=Pleurostoma richardsiae TaxID=41990 RepID=A0AA38RVP7_9PEZI|nr:Thioesterase family protein [Pleurostoma richardsiae]